MKTKIISILGINLILAQLVISVVYAASTITITNNSNGTQSTNSGSLVLDDSIEVLQNNTVEVQNQITQEANTGNNTVTDGSGDIEIVTGAINTQTEVTNDVGTNNMDIVMGSGVNEFGFTNNGNGSDSDNSIVTVVDTAVNIAQNNVIGLENTSNKALNSGYNSASDSSGNIYILTGNISEVTKFSNSFGNNNAGIQQPSGFVVDASNSKNGSGSSNSIDLALSSTITLSQQNEIDVVNKEHKDLNTGGNECYDVAGDCTIKTGDINSKTSITNRGGQNNVVVSHGSVSPTPTGRPIGGVVPEVVVDPTPTPTPIEPKVEPKSLIEEIIDKIVPVVVAAASPQVEQGKVQGAMELPVTGFGNAPYVSWLDVLFGADLLALGYFLRRKFQIKGRV